MWMVPAAIALAGGAWIGWWVRGREAPSASATPATFTQLTDFPGIERTPSVSPDGKTIVYAGSSSGNFDIYLLRVGGRNPVNLTPDCPTPTSRRRFRQVDSRLRSDPTAPAAGFS